MSWAGTLFAALIVALLFAMVVIQAIIAAQTVAIKKAVNLALYDEQGYLRPRLR